MPVYVERTGKMRDDIAFHLGVHKSRPYDEQWRGIRDRFLFGVRSVLFNVFVSDLWLYGEVV
jgi:hypothetical protein